MARNLAPKTPGSVPPLHFFESRTLVTLSVQVSAKKRVLKMPSSEDVCKTDHGRELRVESIRPSLVSEWCSRGPHHSKLHHYGRKRFLSTKGTGHNTPRFMVQSTIILHLRLAAPQSIHVRSGLLILNTRPRRD
jgi:hypothetical protein